MRHVLALLLTLGVFPGLSENRQTQVAPISLYAQFQQKPSDTVLLALQEEVQSIMEPAGLRFEWRSLAANRGNEISVELAVLTFRGRCDVGGLMPHQVNPGALGWTHVSDGAILPFSEVDCDRIRGFIQRDLLGVRSEHREEAFGRALGRVVAHELYHIFANTAQHGSCGVGKAAFTVQELLSDDFQLQAHESEALRTSRARTLLEYARGGY